MNPTNVQNLNNLMIQLMNLLLFLTIAFFIASLVIGMKRKKQLKPVLKTRLECLNCGYRVEREYRRGDYIGKVEGKCPKCGSPLVVTAVYEERVEEKQEEERLLRLVERRASGSRGMRAKE